MTPTLETALITGVVALLVKEPALAGWRALKASHRQEDLRDHDQDRADERYVLKEVCIKCEQVRTSERESMGREMGEVKTEVQRVRDSIHDLRNKLPAMLIAAIKEAAE